MPMVLNELRNAALAAGVASAGFDKVTSEPNARAQQGQANHAQTQQPTVGVVDLVRSQRGEGFYAALPQETRDLFADQPGGQVNWYAAAPLDLPLQHDLHKKRFLRSASGAPSQPHARLSVPSGKHAPGRRCRAHAQWRPCRALATAAAQRFS